MSNLGVVRRSIALPSTLTDLAHAGSSKTGLPLCAATNPAPNAIIDPHGQVVSQLPYKQIAPLRGQVYRSSGTHTAVREGTQHPGTGAAMFLLAAAGAALKSKRRSPQA